MRAVSEWCETLVAWTPSTRQGRVLDFRFGFAVQAASPFSGCGAVLWRLLTGSLDIFLSGGTAAFKAGPPIFSVLDGVSNGLDLFQMPFLDLPDSFIYGAVLLPDESF